MEKVKITVEQEKALNIYARHHNYADFVSGKVCFEDSYKSLEFFVDEVFALLLCGWYEVEQPFKLGDWMKGKISGDYAKVVNKSDSAFSVLYTDNKNDSYYDIDFKHSFEKVTEPWKIMLLELGRENPEFDKNDIIVTESEVYEAEYLTDEEIIVLFEKDLVRAFHAAEHRIEVKGHES